MKSGTLPRAAIGPFPADDLKAGPSGESPGSVWIVAFSTIVIAYVVQFNVLPVYLSLPRANSHQSMMRALMIGMGLAFLLYLTMDLLSYLTFGNASYEFTLEEYTDMPGGNVATVLFGCGQLLSYPIIAFTAVRL